MALTAYTQETQRLLNDETAVEYTVADLTVWINIARGQISAASQSIRVPATIAAVTGQNSYFWTNAIVANANTLGIGGIINVKSIGLTLPFGQTVPMRRRAWPWFNYYYLQSIVPLNGPPKRWSTLQDGMNGNFWVAPTPDQPYTFVLDPVCLPQVLVSDSTPEPLQYPYTDAVPYFAAYLAFLNAQRMADAAMMLQRFSMFGDWAVKMVTGTQLPMTYPGGMGAKSASEHMLVTGSPQ